MTALLAEIDDTSETDDLIDLGDFAGGNIKSERTMAAFRVAGSNKKAIHANNKSAQPGAEASGDYAKIIDALKSGKDEDLKAVAEMLARQKGLSAGSLNELMRLLMTQGMVGSFELNWLDLIPDGISSLEGKRQGEWLVRTVHLLLMMQSNMQMMGQVPNPAVQQAFARLQVTEQRIVQLMQTAAPRDVVPGLQDLLRESATRQAMGAVAQAMRQQPGLMEFTAYQRVGLQVATPWLTNIDRAAGDLAKAMQDLGRQGKLNPLAANIAPENIRLAQALQTVVKQLQPGLDPAAVAPAILRVQSQLAVLHNAAETQRDMVLPPSFKDALAKFSDSVAKVTLTPTRTVIVEAPVIAAAPIDRAVNALVNNVAVKTDAAPVLTPANNNIAAADVKTAPRADATLIRADAAAIRVEAVAPRMVADVKAPVSPWAGVVMTPTVTPAMQSTAPAQAAPIVATNGVKPVVETVRPAVEARSPLAMNGMAASSIQTPVAAAATTVQPVRPGAETVLRADAVPSKPAEIKIDARPVDAARIAPQAATAQIITTPTIEARAMPPVATPQPAVRADQTVTRTETPAAAPKAEARNDLQFQVTDPRQSAVQTSAPTNLQPAQPVQTAQPNRPDQPAPTAAPRDTAVLARDTITRPVEQQPQLRAEAKADVKIDPVRQTTDRPAIEARADVKTALEPQRPVTQDRADVVRPTEQRTVTVDVKPIEARIGEVKTAEIRQTVAEQRPVAEARPITEARVIETRPVDTVRTDTSVRQETVVRADTMTVKETPRMEQTVRVESVVRDTPKETVRETASAQPTATVTRADTVVAESRVTESRGPVVEPRSQPQTEQRAPEPVRPVESFARPEPVAQPAAVSRIETPAAAAPATEPRRVEEPVRIESRREEARTPEPARIETPRVEAARIETPRIETPRQEAPTPVVEARRVEEPVRIEVRPEEPRRVEEPARIEPRREPEAAKTEIKWESNASAPAASSISRDPAVTPLIQTERSVIIEARGGSPERQSEEIKRVAAAAVQPKEPSPTVIEAVKPDGYKAAKVADEAAKIVPRDATVQAACPVHGNGPCDCGTKARTIGVARPNLGVANLRSLSVDPNNKVIKDPLAGRPARCAGCSGGNCGSCPMNVAAFAQTNTKQAAAIR